METAYLPTVWQCYPQNWFFDRVSQNWMQESLWVSIDIQNPGHKSNNQSQSVFLCGSRGKLAQVIHITTTYCTFMLPRSCKDKKNASWHSTPPSPCHQRPSAPGWWPALLGQHLRDHGCNEPLVETTSCSGNTSLATWICLVNHLAIACDLLVRD